MKKNIILTITCFLTFLSSWGGNEVPVSFDERVDLMNVIWRLAGAKEYNQCRILPLTENVDSVFAPFKNHNAVMLAREYYKNYGIAYDAVPSFALHLKKTKRGLWTFDEDIESSMDERWTPKIKSDFLSVLNDFYTVSEFQKWHKNFEGIQKDYLDAFSLINKDIDLKWFKEIFNTTADFRIILSPLSGINNYGMNNKMKTGAHILSPVISCASYEGDSISYDKEGVLPIVIHEFCHAYCNPIIDGIWNDIAEKSQVAFDIKKEVLSQQAYTTAKIMMYETFVRTSVIKYILDHNNGNRSVLPELINEEEQKGFILVSDILSSWENSQKECCESCKGTSGKTAIDMSMNSLDSVSKMLCKAVNSFTKEAYEAKILQIEKNRVQYICNITDGQKDIVSGEFTLTITFDRPMVKSISIGETTQEFPEFKSYAWSEDAKTLCVVFHLEPNRTYGISVLGSMYNSIDGKTASDKTIIFKTKNY